ncbi:hypothetical protein PROFUN_03915 [Planoprotostelium fungivorum]|uniref:NAD-dependent epimerase/dehydratase domain-containing protein n=1 Tax=Planoprotostelium fungivorum TaxID=1890364 RepID=A0A2P6MTP5_9EUKA|nr:hypothetical protein PROFUN_03915 [Planoprotostelium fungivorum]
MIKSPTITQGLTLLRNFGRLAYVIKLVIRAQAQKSRYNKQTKAMPTPAPQSLILVTGVTGYLAAHVAEQLLDKGYRVRGTARTASKAEYLKKKWGDRFEWVNVSDLIEDGAFDEAVKDVDGIMHVASPFHYNVSDPYKDLIEPARKGTLSLLSAALKNGKKVQRIVITSSFAACAEPKDGSGYIYTEKDWNEFSIKEVEQKGKETSPQQAYRASKSEAERVAWDFIKEKKPQFDLVTINPTFIFGPILHQVEDPKDLNTSVAFVYKMLTGETKEIAAPAPSQAFVDVRDVAKAHVNAIEKEEAGGKRFLTTSAQFGFQQVADILRAKYPELKDKIPEGKPGQNYSTTHSVSNEEAKRVLNIEFMGLEKTIVDTAEDLKEKFLQK